MCRVGLVGLGVVVLFFGVGVLCMVCWVVMVGFFFAGVVCSLGMLQQCVFTAFCLLLMGLVVFLVVGVCLLLVGFMVLKLLDILRVLS